MKPACRMPCWTGTTGEKLHDSISNFSFITVSSGMHLQSSLMMMMIIYVRREITNELSVVVSC